MTGPTTANAVYEFVMPDGSIGALGHQTCTLDSAAIPCDVQQPLQMTGLTVGPHTFTASGTDYNGVATSGSATWTQLAVMPIPANLTFTDGPALTTDVTSATIAYTTTGAVASVVCLLDGAPVPCSATSAVLTGLSVGTHMLTVQALGIGGDSPLYPYQWTVTAPVPGLPLTVAVTQVTRTTASVIVSFAAGYSGSFLTSPVCTFDSKPVDCVTSSFTQLTNVALGRHTVTVSGVGPDGNTTTGSATWTQKTAAPPAPTVTVTVTQSGRATAEAAFFIMQGQDSTTAGTMSLIGNPVCRLDGTALACGNQQFVELTGLALGKHTFSVSGNEATTGVPVRSSATWTQKTAVPPAPPVTLTLGQTGLTTAGGSVYVLHGYTPGTMWYISDAVCKLDGTAVPCGNQQSLQLTGLAIGKHTFAVSGNDTVTGIPVTSSVTWTQSAVWVPPTSGNETNEETLLAGHYVIIENLYETSTSVKLNGLTVPSLDGQRVNVKLGGRVVAHTTATASGAWSVTAPLPPARQRYSVRAHYTAASGGKTSPMLTLGQRIVITGVTHTATKSIISGHVVGPLFPSKTGPETGVSPMYGLPSFMSMMPVLNFPWNTVTHGSFRLVMPRIKGGAYYRITAAFPHSKLILASLCVID